VFPINEEEEDNVLQESPAKPCSLQDNKHFLPELTSELSKCLPKIISKIFPSIDSSTSKSKPAFSF